MNSKIPNSKFLIPNFVWAIFFFLMAQTAFSGQLSLGAEFLGWSTNYTTPFNGYELWAPLSLNFKAAPDFTLYGQTEFGYGSYTDSIGGPHTTNLANFSDTVLGWELQFQSFGLPAVFNVGFNVPTGDPTWEAKQINANPPVEFVGSRYRGRGFGVSGLYGLSFPSGNGGEFGAAAGYMYAGAFNPSYGGLPSSNLKMGDSVFLSLNHVQHNSDNQNEVIRLSSYYSLPTQNNGQSVYQLGLNFNASYSWINPRALSLELGGQYWLPGQIQNAGGGLSTEPNAYYGPRFYLNPSYGFGDFNLAGRFKYVLPNGYAQSNSFYDGGGFLAGLEPSLVLKLDSSSDLKLSTSFDYIAWQNVLSADGSRDATALYSLWTVGTTYEVKL